MLPSQTTPTSRYKHTFRRRRRRWLRPFLLLGLGLVAVLVIWKMWPSGDADPGPTEARKLTPALVPSTKESAAPRPVAESRGPAQAQAETTTTPRGETKTVARPEPVQAPVHAAGQTPGQAPGQLAAADSPERPTEPATEREPDPAPEQAAAPPAVVMGSRSATRPPTTLDLPPAPVRRADELINAGRLVEARALLSRVLAGRLSPAEADAVRERLRRLNETMVFDPMVVPGDPYAMHYTIQSGDSLAKITHRLSLLADWRFIQRINGIARPERIRVDQRIKLITGPFHAVIDKTDFRMDVYLGDSEERVYVWSFPVGLGRFNATPTGRFRIRRNSKLIDPEWTHPHTGRRYGAADPLNPIGEYWIGLEGIDATNASTAGYGIHGTIEPETIGQQASMGCVRMRHEDVAIVYEMLTEGVSEVLIVE